PVSDAELNRARRKIMARFVFARESVHSLCDSIAAASTYPGSPDPAKYYQDYLTRAVTVSKADIQRVAKKYLSRKQSAIVWSVPQEDEKKCGEPNASSTANPSTLFASIGRANRSDDRVTNL